MTVSAVPTLISYSYFLNGVLNSVLCFLCFLPSVIRNFLIIHIRMISECSKDSVIPLNDALTDLYKSVEITVIKVNPSYIRNALVFQQNP